MPNGRQPILVAIYSNLGQVNIEDGLMGEMIDLNSAGALAFFEAGRLSDAAAACDQALSVNALDSTALHLRGLIAAKQGRVDAAIADMRASIDLSPMAADFHSNLAAVLGRAGRTSEAIAALREAIRLRPDFAMAHNNLGVAFERLERNAEAAESYRRALSSAGNW